MTSGVLDLTDSRPKDRSLCPMHGPDIFQDEEPCRGCGNAKQFRKTPEYAMLLAERRSQEAERERNANRVRQGLDPLGPCDFEDDGSGMTCIKCQLPPGHSTHRAAVAAVPAQRQESPSEQAGPLPAPVFFVRSAPSAQLPASVRGTVLGRVACAIEEAWGVPSLLSAIVGLGVVCAATRGRQEFRIASGQTFPVALYLAPLAPPGSMKSAVLDRLKAPLAEAQRKQAKGSAVLQQKLEAYQAAARTTRDALSKAIAESKADTELERIENDLNALDKQASLLRQGLADGKTVLFGGDLTAEALAARSAANLGPVSVLSAEGGLIENVAGRYNDGAANTEFLNSAYDGEEYSRERIGSGSQQIERPWCSLLLVVQPDVLSTIVESTQMRRRGFMQRIWFANVPRAGYRPRHSLDEPPAELMAEWTERIRGIWKRDPRILGMAGAAEAPLNEFDDRIVVPRITAACESDDELMIGWLAKAGITAKRVAAAMQLLEDPAATVVTAQIAAAAADLAALLVEHNEHLFTGSVHVVESSPRSRVLSFLADTLEKNRQNRQNPSLSVAQGSDTSDSGGFVGIDGGLFEVVSEGREGPFDAQIQGSVGFGGFFGLYVSTRTIQRRFEGQKWCRGVGDVKAVLQDLVAMDWLAGPVKGPVGTRGGRPPELWQLHPELVEHWNRMRSGLGRAEAAVLRPSESRTGS